VVGLTRLVSSIMKTLRSGSTRWTAGEAGMSKCVRSIFVRRSRARRACPSERGAMSRAGCLVRVNGETRPESARKWARSPRATSSLYC